MVAASAEQPYTFASDPRAVRSGRKFRDAGPAPEMGPAGVGGAYPMNIMYDRRVVRGNTYAAQIVPAVPADESASMPKTVKRRTKHIRGPAATDPVEGRRHMDVQTDSYLEELTDVVPESDIAVQTDPFIDRPPTPLFVPAKTGVDAVTQILPGELFDFDFEVEPILEVLVGKTLEQGMMEVMEEEELAAMRAHQEHFEQIRNAELVATQRMEAAEKRKVEEKARRLAQERERLDREKMVREKVAASVFSRGYLSGIVSGVYDKLYADGFFYDPVEKEVETDFLPWLQEEMVPSIDAASTSRAAVESLVLDALQRTIDAAETSAGTIAEHTAAAEKEAAWFAEDLTTAEAEARAAVFEAASDILAAPAAEPPEEGVPHFLKDAIADVLAAETIAEKREALTIYPEAEQPEVAEGEEPPAEAPEPPPPILPEDSAVLEALLADGAVTLEALMLVLSNARAAKIAFEEEKAAEAAA